MARTKSEGKVSKRKMVEAAMEELPDAKPAELRELIIERFDTDINTQMISSYRSNLRKGAGSPPRGRADSGARHLAGLPDDATYALRDLQAVRDLIARLGAPQLMSLVKLLAK